MCVFGNQIFKTCNGRGYQGKLLAEAQRRDIADFIALMRQQEAADDENEYWLTHPISRIRHRLWSKLRRVDERELAAKVKYTLELEQLDFNCKQILADESKLQSTDES